MREAMNDALETVEDDVLKPMLEQTVASIDSLAGDYLPEEFNELYLKAKSEIESSVNYIQEHRDDLSDELKEWEEELKKAGEFVDDMKVEIAKMATVIAVSFVPGVGPLLAIALQVILDEIAGNESIFDTILEGDVADIGQLLSAVAQALPVVGAPAKVMVAVENAQKALSVFNQVMQNRDAIESMVKGEFDNLQDDLLSLVINQGVNYLGDVDIMPENIADVLLNEDLLMTMATGNSDEIKADLLGAVANKVGGYLDDSLPGSVTELISSDEILQTIITGDSSILEDKVTNLLTEKVGTFLGDNLPANLDQFLDQEAIAQILNGDIDQLGADLQAELIGQVSFVHH